MRGRGARAGPSRRGPPTCGGCDGGRPLSRLTAVAIYADQQHGMIAARGSHGALQAPHPGKARTFTGFAAKRLQSRNYGHFYAAVRLKISCTGARFGSFAAVPPRMEWAADEMKTLRSELDERLDDLVEAVGQTVGQRIDLLEEETRGLREELRSELDGVRRSIRLLSIAVILALVGVLTTLLLELL